MKCLSGAQRNRDHDAQRMAERRKRGDIAERHSVHGGGNEQRSRDQRERER